MPVVIYKSTTSSRSMDYQDKVLAPIRAEHPDAPIYVDAADRTAMVRPTTRSGRIEAYAASIAVYADTEKELTEFLKSCQLRKIALYGVEEDFGWYTPQSISLALQAWKRARKAGASKRGAEKSAATKKAKTAAALKLIEDDLKKDKYTTRELLDRVGVKAINSIKNHYGITREEMQRRYQAEQKRKARREAYHAARV